MNLKFRSRLLVASFLNFFYCAAAAGGLLLGFGLVGWTFAPNKITVEPLYSEHGYNECSEMFLTDISV